MNNRNLVVLIAAVICLVAGAVASVVGAVMHNRTAPRPPDLRQLPVERLQGGSHVMDIVTLPAGERVMRWHNGYGSCMILLPPIPITQPETTLQK